MFTVEVARKLVDRFGLGFTDDYVLRSIQRGELERVSKPYNGVRDSKYGFAVSKDSLVKFLLNHGVTEREINTVLMS